MLPTYDQIWFSAGKSHITREKSPTPQSRCQIIQMSANVFVADQAVEDHIIGVKNCEIISFVGDTSSSILVESVIQIRNQLRDNE